MPATITFQHYEVLVRADGSPWELGRGAMGVTYKALDKNLRVPVALKVIHPRQLDSELVAQRFVREARAAARLRHPHIAAVYHLGQEGENWFYAMEFVDGDTAEALVKCEGPLPEPTVLTLAIQAARALNAAAALGLVHRDIKPSNLMLARDSDEWQLKVIDFGLARTFKGDESDEDLAAVTHSGFVGTPYYASPEQLEQHELDIRSDIYSLGVTLWFLLTGRVPFTGSVVSVLSQHLHKAPPFEQLDGVVSPATRQILERMLAKNPAARPQSALDLRHDLERCEEDLPGTEARAERKSVPATPPQPSVVETAETIIAPEVRFTPGESQFDAADTVAEFGFGQLCRARERTTGTDFAILRLGAQRELDDASLVHLRETIACARQIEHEQVWKVHALETDGDGLRIVMAWSEGYPWRELLRRRRELEPAAALPLLAQAARGIDAILAAKIDQPDVTLAGLWCEAPTPDAPPTNVKVSPLGVLRSLSNDATWVGDGTLAGGAGSPITGVSGAIRSLAEVAYETLGGITTAPGFPPLPALSEVANKVLRTALRDPGQFPTATALIEQIIRGQTEAAPIPTFRAPTLPADRKALGTQANEPPRAASTVGSEASGISAEPATPSQELGDETPALPPEEPAIVPEESAAVESPVASGEWQLPSRSRGRGLVAAATLAVLTASAAWFYHYRTQPAPQKPSEESAPPATPLAEPSSKIAVTTPEATPVPTPKPAPKPAPATPPPAPVATPPPATPPPATPPPGPSRTEIARQRSDQADDLRKKQLWEDAAKLLVALPRDFPEFKSAAIFDLERLFREIRWHYTPRTDRLTQVTRTQVEALVDEAEAAATLGVPAAMMLLGQHYTDSDWGKAIGWYEKASPLTPKAHTRIGLVLAKMSPTPDNLKKAWQHFLTAANAGDLDGKISASECYLYGTMGDPPKPVQGLERDELRGVKLLEEVVATVSDSTVPEAHADAGRADTGETRPNSAKVALATFYLDLETAPAADRPAWYREEAKTIDHGKRIRQLLTEAKSDRIVAYQQLARAALAGVGGKKDEKEAIAYFKEGKERGEPSCMYNYAVYLKGTSSPSSMPAEARDLMIRAAEKSDPRAREFCQANKIAFKTKAPP